jgi:hypothetical protein
MRRQVWAWIAASAMFAALCFAPTPQAMALPKTGNHTLKFACDVGLYHSTFQFNYSIAFVRTEAPPSNPSSVTYIYNWQLNTATYTGNTPNPARGPHVEIESFPAGPGPGMMLNGTVGGATSTSARVFGSGQATAPTASKTNGAGGVTWNPVEMRHNPSLTPNPRARITWWNQPTCTQWIDLGFPNAPFEGVQDTPVLFCNNNESEPFMDSFNLEYDIFNVSGDIYAFQIRKMYLNPDIGGPPGHEGVHSIDISLRDSDNADINAGPTLPNFFGSTWITDYSWPHLFVDGDDAVIFPQVNFKYTPTGSVPYVNVNFAHSIDGGAVVGVCDTRVDLVNNWLPEDNYFNTDTIQFNDCSGTPNAGTLAITGNWELNSNGTKVKLKSVVIHNDSAAQLRLPALSGQNPVFKEGTQTLTFMNSSAQTADRNWAAGETKTLNISDPSKWTVAVSGLDSPAPNTIVIEQPPSIPEVSMNFDAFDSIGADCPTGFALEDVSATGEL